MRVDELSMEYAHCGVMTVKVWAKCHSVEDCEQLIEWLKLAQHNMREWQKISPPPPKSKP